MLQISTRLGNYKLPNEQQVSVSNFFKKYDTQLLLFAYYQPSQFPHFQDFFFFYI